jgi:hypothetical protein
VCDTPSRGAVHVAVIAGNARLGEHTESIFVAQPGSRLPSALAEGLLVALQWQAPDKLHVIHAATADIKRKKSRVGNVRITYITSD